MVRVAGRSDLVDPVEQHRVDADAEGEAAEEDLHGAYVGHTSALTGYGARHACYTKQVV